MPRSLGLDSHSYGRNQFYSDVQAYIRFKTPRLSLAALADRANDQSPLTRSRRLLIGTSGDPSQLNEAKITREMQLLACMLRADLRDRSSELRRDIKDHSVVELRQPIHTLIEEASLLSRSFRELRPEFHRAGYPDWLADLYSYVDEYLSICVETYLTSVLASLDKHRPSRTAFGKLRGELTNCLVSEQQLRSKAGYLSVLRLDSDHHSFLYRKSALKKFMSSVLFLELSKEPEGKGLANIGAGIAAAVAMVFSTVTAIWSQLRYGLNSIPFVLAIVIGYVFKDRIKEWLRAYFSGRVARYIYDHSVHIHDPAADRPVGRCRESFNYLSPGKIPANILAHRHADSTSALEQASKPETVMRYVKDVRLRSKSILRSHGRLANVNDIVRLNLSNFLSRMAQPIQQVHTYSDALGRVTQIPCPKSYHVNLVMVLMAEGKAASVARFRLIMNKHGILRIEEVPLDTPQQA